MSSGKLGGYFVEARYHLVQSQRETELEKIARRFENHLKSTFSSGSLVPSQLDELNERIATLSALLETPGSKGLEYYLARLYEARGTAGDIEKALKYARRATGPKAPTDSWLLQIRLEVKINGLEAAFRVAQQGIVRVSADDKLVALYRNAGELLAQMGKTDEAIALLKDGITKIPADKNVSELYQSAGELLAQMGKTDEAIALLKDGITKIPVDKNVVELYQSAGELLAQMGKTDEAIALLKDGIARVPADTLSPLYQGAGELLAKAGKPDEAIALLQDGIAKVPAGKGLGALYQAGGLLFMQIGHADKVIQLVKEGLNRIPVGDLSVPSLLEPAINILHAQQHLETFDEFFFEIPAPKIPRQSLGYGKVLRLVLKRDWELAARTAHEEQLKSPHYRALFLYEAFCWLSVNNISAAKIAATQIEVKGHEGDPSYWLRAWIDIKSGDITSAENNLGKYLDIPINNVVNEIFLLQLWDTAPTIGTRIDLAYYFPILPASLTGLHNDVVRLPYGPSVIGRTIAVKDQLHTPPILHPVTSDIPFISQTSWPDWMEEIINNSGNNPHLDVGIVIALEEEFRELAQQVRSRPFRKQDFNQYYYLFEHKKTEDGLAPYRCVVTFIGKMGPTEASVASERLMAQFNPATIVSIGIAGSMDKDVLVGDVVVAEQTDEYLASSKAIETKDKLDWEFRFSGDPYKTDPAYVADATNLRYAHEEATKVWENSSKLKLKEWVGTVKLDDLIQQKLIGSVPSIYTGHIASGPIVGAANQFVQWLKEKRDRKYLALEMESVGVLNAAHKRGASSLIIRGISDYTDPRKDQLDGIGSGVLRRYAMNNALGLLWVLMDLQLLKSSKM